MCCRPRCTGDQETSLSAQKASEGRSDQEWTAVNIVKTAKRAPNDQERKERYLDFILGMKAALMVENGQNHWLE